MTTDEILLILALVSAPITLALIVAMIRGYTISLHLTREQRKGGRWTHDRSRRDDDKQS